MRLKKKDRWTHGTYEQHEEMILYFEFCFLYHGTYSLFWRSIFSHKKPTRLFLWNEFLKGGTLLYVFEIFTCSSQIIRTTDPEASTRLPMEKEVVDYCERSIALRKQLTGDEHKVS